MTQNGHPNKREGRCIETSSNVSSDNIYFGALIEQMTEALVVLDLDLTIRYANQAFFTLFGYNKNEIVGVNIKVIGIHDRFASMSPDELAQTLRDEMSWQGEVLRRDKEGQYIPVLVTSKLTFNDDGKSTGYMTTYIDLRKIKNAETRLKNGLTNCIFALAGAIERRDVFKFNHSVRVHDLSIAIALELGLDTSFIEGLSLAAMLHEVGKIHVPTEMLNNVERLSQGEINFLQRHPETSHDVLKDIDLPWPIAKIILQHQERLDGSGYPNKLKGNEILPAAKIIAVASVIVTMHSDRPYRNGHDMEACLAEIEGGREILYDSKIVDACVKIIRKGHFKIPRGWTKY